MVALVTGGGGFLGRHLVEQLLARGESVRILARQEYPALRRLGVDCHQADLRDPVAVSRACAGVDCVYHVAALAGIWGDPRLFHEINILGTQHVIAGCRAHAVPRLVFTSSPSVVFDGRDHRHADESLPYPGRYLCDYPRTKALAEQQVLAANSPQLATVALRPHLVWGPRDGHLIPRLVARARAGRLVRVGSGHNQISVTYVENAAAAHWQAADRLTPTAPHAGRAYFINDPEPVR
ncbi:MAG: NAD-dependent epimerase/dehydratase family protein, partial [Planctomycetaceae bacterium]